MKNNNKMIRLIILISVIELISTGIGNFFRDQQFLIISNAFAQVNEHHSFDHQFRYIIILVALIFAFAVLIWLVIKKQTSKLLLYNELEDTHLTQQRQSHWHIYILAIIFFLVLFTAVNTFIHRKSSDNKLMLKQNDTKSMTIQTEINQNKIIQYEKIQPPESILEQTDTLHNDPENEIMINNEPSQTKSVNVQSSDDNQAMDSTYIHTSERSNTSNIQTNKPDKSNPKQAVLTESTDKKAVTKNSITNSIGMTFVYIPPVLFKWEAQLRKNDALYQKICTQSH
ncbi:MAG: hypothetical protein OMM_05526 [Candidatus Magnetoglobus multicellularis str. Araruama]|uniref:Uncharacterized protein n=1 Tax=Candidatus Magnetoglobus multicellularis str. Araruama TaxID=890399 RepID=A0A1V1NW35_9BACT|nr:MAG: hypothetical protein OMM_05526 [Candidatus Magnetoglobus multicellularis str. Araruama]